MIWCIKRYIIQSGKIYINENALDNIGLQNDFHYVKARLC